MQARCSASGSGSTVIGVGLIAAVFAAGTAIARQALHLTGIVIAVVAAAGLLAAALLAAEHIGRITANETVAGLCGADDYRGGIR